MSVSSHPLRQSLKSHLEDVAAALPALRPNAAMRDDGRVFVEQGTTDRAFHFDVTPIVFNVPEKPRAPECLLYIVVEGKIALQKEAYQKKKELVTDTFTSRLAYFRKKKETLEHVYGAHFDFSNDDAHPVFHSQLRAYPDLHKHVLTHFPDATGTLINHLHSVLETVRLPSAQIDVFSLLLQICADHLIHASSGRPEREAFNKLLAKAVLRGAGGQCASLSAPAASGCFRSRHWYRPLNAT